MVSRVVSIHLRFCPRYDFFLVYNRGFLCTRSELDRHLNIFELKLRSSFRTNVTRFWNALLPEVSTIDFKTTLYREVECLHRSDGSVKYSWGLQGYSPSASGGGSRILKTSSLGPNL